MGDTPFGPTIKHRRDSLGLSQARVAELVGRSSSTIRSWERGSATPSSPADVVALAAILGTDEDELLTLAGFEPTAIETSPTLEQALAELRAHRGVAPDLDEPADHDEDAARPQLPRETTGPETAEAEPPAPGRDEEAPAVEMDAELPAGEMDAGLPAGEMGMPMEAPEVTDAGVPPLDDWSAERPELTRAERRRQAAVRAAPPTVLETTPPGEPSYLEDPEERQYYRVRALVTAAVVVAMLIMFLWAFDRTTDTLGDMWQQFVDMLSI